ncbi:MAG: nitroreductase family deazaflavin-dependent oxidoreductase [Acidimicrobiia bacterium]|nr:nitroreductase family deazaflavin-dependent oxidoreductase [Acidimicrobiia bacterium]MBT8216743.1 nitroreductase family deazaflavin-dependent oxidoreductase [Acidimicrobiia bacterium]NNL69775.1 nitroreductase family deazaflavin-dependent oxidoreductase [Acidimicrobiia bacterium]
MKHLFRLGTTLHAKIVKATGKLGGGTEDGSVLVLEHTGAKSGKSRETPLMFLNGDGGYLVCGSMAGAPKHPAWYHNLKANPDAVITVDRREVPVRARELEGKERSTAWERFTRQNDRWEQYQSKTERTLPLLLLEPR